MVPFVYLASVCRSLRCLISALTQEGRGGLLFRLPCSVALRGGRGAADKYRCVWGAFTVFWPHWVCPAHGCVLSPSTLLMLPAALYEAGPVLHVVPVPVIHKNADSVGPAFCAFPGLSCSGIQELDGHTLPGCGAPSPLQSQPQFLCASCLFLGAGL